MPHISPAQADAISVLLIDKPTIHELENMIIQHCLNKTNANIVLVARDLGIGKSSIYRRLHNNELDFPKR